LSCVQGSHLSTQSTGSTSVWIRPSLFWSCIKPHTLSFNTPISTLTSLDSSSHRICTRDLSPCSDLQILPLQHQNKNRRKQNRSHLHSSTLPTQEKVIVRFIHHHHVQTPILECHPFVITVHDTRATYPPTVHELRVSDSSPTFNYSTKVFVVNSVGHPAPSSPRPHTRSNFTPVFTRLSVPPTSRPPTPPPPISPRSQHQQLLHTGSRKVVLSYSNDGYNVVCFVVIFHTSYRVLVLFYYSFRDLQHQHKNGYSSTHHLL
jgi:hypothetical protein